jgi:hypothetical protein
MIAPTVGAIELYLTSWVGVSYDPFGAGAVTRKGQSGTVIA